MANVLTTASTVSCGHEPSTITVASDAKLRVNGNPVLLANGVANAPILVCGTIPNSDPVSKQCLKITVITAGFAAKLRSNGQVVVLDSLAGQTDGTVNKVTPQSNLKATANQDKLSAA